MVGEDATPFARGRDRLREQEWIGPPKNGSAIALSFPNIHPSNHMRTQHPASERADAEGELEQRVAKGIERANVLVLMTKDGGQHGIGEISREIHADDHPGLKQAQGADGKPRPLGCDDAMAE